MRLRTRSRTPRRLHLIPAFLAGLCTLSLIPGTAGAGAPRVILLEDFGATWCDACTDARCGTEMLVREFPDQIVHFEYHISDQLAIPESQERKSFYGIYGLPHVRIDGIDFVKGATGCASAYEAYRLEVRQRIFETGGQSPVAVEGYFVIDTTPASEIRVTATFTLLERETLPDLRATLILYENEVDYCCGINGEDTWSYVCRALIDEPAPLHNPGDSFVLERTIPIVHGPEPWDAWDPEQLHMLAYLQSTSTKEVFQAARLEVRRPAAVEGAPVPGPALLTVNPNPLRAASRIGFRVLDGAAPSEVALFDARGRRLRTLYEGRPGEGYHEVAWPGAGPGRGVGEDLRRGVYFVRFVNGPSAQTRKIIRAR